MRLEHRFERGVSAGLRVPTGTIRVDPVGDATSPVFVSGPGDIELNVAYDLGRLWGLTGTKPSVRVRPVLTLPSGESAKVDDDPGEVPPNLVAIGNGAIGVGLEVQASKYIARSWALKAWGSARGPLTYSDTNIRYGTNLGYGLGAAHRVTDKLILDASVRGAHRRRSRSRTNGTLTNSGGDWLFADMGATFLATNRFAFGVGATLPFYADVNGTQISQSWGARGFVAVTFGLSDEDEHDHGDEDEHNHTDGDMDMDEHVGSGDVRVLAAGGASFELADAVVAGKIVVIDYWAHWCKPCKVIERDLERLAADHAELVVWRVEVPDFDSPVAVQHLKGAKGLPIIWILDRTGTVVHRLDAAAPKQVLETLNELLATPKATGPQTPSKSP